MIPNRSSGHLGVVGQREILFNQIVGDFDVRYAALEVSGFFRGEILHIFIFCQGTIAAILLVSTISSSL